MTVSFHNFKSDENCSICLDKLTGSDALAHNNIHPGHRECIKEWAKINPTCPICRVGLDVNSLFTWSEAAIAWKDRNITELREIAKDAFQGAISGALVGVVFFNLSSKFLGTTSLEKNDLPPDMSLPAILVLKAAAEAGRLIGSGAEVLTSATGIETTAGAALAGAGLMMGITVIDGLLYRRGLPHFRN